MNEKTIDSQVLRETAETLFADGYCCSEAVVLAAIEHLAPSTPRDSVKLATGLCGGMGDRGATCGVFTGAAMAAGLVIPEDERKAHKARSRELAMQLRSTLEREAGGHVCQDILKQMGLKNINKRLCRKLTGRGAELLGELLTQSK